MIGLRVSLSLAIISVVANLAHAEVREYTLGIDDLFAPPVDTVYIDSVWLNELTNAFGWEVVAFDDPVEPTGAEMIPFSFVFDLTGGEWINAASLTFRLAPNGGGPTSTDSIRFDQLVPEYNLVELGWNQSQSVLTIDLGNVLGDGQIDLLPLLADGLLNCMVQDDSVIDYATLTLCVILDCNTNQIPDECDVDCGTNGGPCDVPGCGQSGDCNSNGVPDECELEGNDCNTNGVPDECDEPDGDGDGVPDECDVCCPSTPPGTAVDSEGRPLGDIDKDCDTDLDDYALFQQGFTGPGS